MDNIGKDETLVNNILVIGNGFDLANKYKTSYKDFINFIKNNDINKYKTNKYYSEFCAVVSNNKFVEYLKDLELDYWADVETEIHRIIDAIKFVYSNDKEQYTYGGVNSDGTGDVMMQIKEPQTRAIVKQFGLIIEISNTNILNKKYMNYYKGVIWKELNSFLNDQLLGLKKLLILYLREFVPDIKVGLKEVISAETLRQLTDINPKTVITFNYTNFYKDVYGQTCTANHVHGDLLSENIVLGYEDDNPNELEFIRFKKYFQRIQYKLKPLDARNDEFNVIDGFMKGFTDNEIYYENMIHCYGLSFDVTDEDYIKVIYNLEHNKQFIVYYYDDEDYDNKMINLIRLFKKERIQEDMYNGKLKFEPIKK